MISSKLSCRGGAKYNRVGEVADGMTDFFNARTRGCQTPPEHLSNQVDLAW